MKDFKVFVTLVNGKEMTNLDIFLEGVVFHVLGDLLVELVSLLLLT